MSAIELEAIEAHVVEQVLTVDEVATLLRCSPDTVYRLIRDDSLPAFRVGRRYRISSTLLKAWIADQTKPEHDAWSQELGSLAEAMRTDLFAQGITAADFDQAIAIALQKVRAGQ